MSHRLKNIISEELDQLLPNQFELNMAKSVMKSIAPVSKIKSYDHQKENLKLFVFTIIMSSFVYVFGFNKATSIQIQLPKGFAFQLVSTLIAGGSILFFLINEHFDRNKKLIV